MNKIFEEKTGAEWLANGVVIVLILLFTVGLGYIIAIGGLKSALALLVLPPILFFLNRFFIFPLIGLFTALFFAFIAIGVTRYIPGIPLGLSVDGFLVMSYIALFFKNFYTGVDWKPAKNDLSLLSLIWFLYAVFEFFNPEALSRTAWFYAMRGMNLYMLLTIPLAFLLLNKMKFVWFFLYVWGVFSILGTLKGIQQLYIGPDYAEQRWLDTTGGITHIIFGELRVFSFFSDAGQFGAAQGHAGIVGMILFFIVKGWKKKVFFLMMGLGGLYGMMISGTRGAISVPMAGMLLYLIHRKNFRALLVGSLIIIGVYSFFRYTYIGQSNAQIRRMRTAFTPTDDASYLVRMQNRAILKTYLASRPFGGGIGSAGDWGKRFSPQGFLANVATDSWYVQIWAEQGIVGLILHLLILGYIIIKSSYYIMFTIKDTELKLILSALASGIVGMMAASYGNGVFGQMPSGIIIYICMAILFMAPQFDNKLVSSTQTDLMKMEKT
ncbi:MAG: O-antigen ligase family protein [Lentimicrobiaceae bacterium]|nr:O-antigen ligase family protein [Lentimicrobiaceae bacterium]